VLSDEPKMNIVHYS